MVGRVPKMGSCPGSEKCRGQGDAAGAEDEDVSRGRVSVHAADGHVVARPDGMSMAAMDKKKPCGDARPGMEGAMGNSCQRSRVRTDGSGAHAARGRGPPVPLDAEVAERRGGGARVR
jgi:hypothetical protein